MNRFDFISLTADNCNTTKKTLYLDQAYCGMLKCILKIHGFELGVSRLLNLRKGTLLHIYYYFLNIYYLKLRESMEPNKLISALILPLRDRSQILLGGLM